MSTAPPRDRLQAHHSQIAKLFDKLPPHALEAECALLGAMILDGQVIGDVVQVLQAGADNFYKAAHGVLYDVLVKLYDQTQQIDMVQLVQRLRDLGQLEEVGGTDYLVQLAESVPSAVTAPHYAKLVREKALLRQLIDAAGKVLYDAYHSGDTVQNQLDQAEQAIFRLAEGRTSDSLAHLHDLLQETYDRLDAQARDGKTITGVETGFIELDDITNGLQNGEMIIVAARPSMGKTAFALNISEFIGATRKQPVAIFSLEMSKQQLAQRLLCARSGVDSHKLRRNMLSSDDFALLHETCAELSDAPIFIDDTPGLSLMALRAKARRLAQRHDIKAVMIDYLQLMSCPGSESRQQEVSELSRGVKGLARELNVPVICLSQLNRAAEGREGHRPRMSDLRESGSIEQDADVIMMLHREAYYNKTDPEWEIQNPDKVNEAEVIIAKQRNGPTGTIRLIFDSASTRFRNAAHTPSGNY